MAPVPCGRCSSWRRIHNTVTGCNPWFPTSTSPVRMAAVPEHRQDSCHLGCPSRACSAAPTARGTNPTGLRLQQQQPRCSPPVLLGHSPPQCRGQPSRSPARPAGAGLLLTNAGRARLQRREPLGVSRRKCTATAPILKTSLASQHPPTAQSRQAPSHTPRIHTDRSAPLYLCELNL